MNARFALLPCLVLVNSTAIIGQAGWAFENITSGGILGIAVAIIFALSLESIGVYLAWESHEALMADQANALLRYGSYAMGLLAGVLNFLHFSVSNGTAGIAFGALSTISPFLWGVWSRARNRGRLAQLGMVDKRGVKLSLSRKIWHPVKSVRVLSWAAWAGETDPQAAVAGWEGSVVVETPARAGKHAARPMEAPAVVAEAPAEAPREAVEAPAEPAEAVSPPVTVLEGVEALRERVLAIRAAEPDLNSNEIGKRVGRSGRRVRQLLKEAAS